MTIAWATSQLLNGQSSKPSLESRLIEILQRSLIASKSDLLIRLDTSPEELDLVLIKLIGHEIVIKKQVRGSWFYQLT